MLSDHRLLGTLVKSTSLLMECELYTCTSIAVSTVSVWLVLVYHSDCHSDNCYTQHKNCITIGAGGGD